MKFSWVSVLPILNFSGKFTVAPTYGLPGVGGCPSRRVASFESMPY
eukprot:SAG31_NODE_586_length_13839_cov_22.698544_6_plen_46_part_00